MEKISHDQQSYVDLKDKSLEDNVEYIIEIKDLTKTYNLGEIDVHALQGINLKIKKGEFISIMGPSGSGKTTLLNLVGALDIPTSGDVLINRIALSTMDDKELTKFRLLHLGFIFQFYNLIPVLSVYESIELPFTFADVLQEKYYGNIMDMMKKLDLQDKMNHLPSELSGGEQQKIAIARALAKKPFILLADEPTGELDTKMGMEIVKLLKQFNSEFNQTIIMVTHDPIIGNMAERHIKMQDGKIIKDYT